MRELKWLEGLFTAGLPDLRQSVSKPNVPPERY
ncbi:MAG: hypothetical protein ACI88A_002967, partial [Paraglaciecola sp.]